MRTLIFGDVDGDAHALGHVADGAGEGGPEVALDVDGERLERGDVDDTDAFAGGKNLGLFDLGLALAAGGFGNLLRGDVDGFGGDALRLLEHELVERHHRKAVRVLPVPVGARMRVLSPRAMAGQPCCWGDGGGLEDLAEPLRGDGVKLQEDVR